METLPTRGRSNTKKVKASGGSTDEARQLEAKRLSLYSRRNHKRRTTQEITFFGLIWKRSKNDLRSSKLKADDVILRSRDGVGSPMKPTCFLCFKPYRSDLMYIRCESCRSRYTCQFCRMKVYYLYLCIVVGFDNLMFSCAQIGFMEMPWNLRKEG
jgi:hypothetical protein